MVAHKILETARVQRPLSLFGLGLGTWDLDSGLSILFWFGIICFIFGLVGLKFNSLDFDLEPELDNN